MDGKWGEWMELGLCHQTLVREDGGVGGVEGGWVGEEASQLLTHLLSILLLPLPIPILVLVLPLPLSFCLRRGCWRGGVGEGNTSRRGRGQRGWRGGGGWWGEHVGELLQQILGIRHHFCSRDWFIFIGEVDRCDVMDVVNLMWWWMGLTWCGDVMGLLLDVVMWCDVVNLMWWCDVMW